MDACVSGQLPFNTTNFSPAPQIYARSFAELCSATAARYVSQTGLATSAVCEADADGYYGAGTFGFKTNTGAHDGYNYVHVCDLVQDWSSTALLLQAVLVCMVVFALLFGFNSGNKL